MIILAATTDKLRLITSAACDVDVHVSYEDRNAAGANASAGRQNTTITTATTTDILSAPGSGIVRRAKTIIIRNTHASTSVDVTVVFDQNGTDFGLHKVTLRAGEALEYVEGVGFYLLATNIVTPLIKVLSADDTGQNVNTAQPWFPTAGAVTVAADTTYLMTGALHTTRAAGSTSHTTGIGFGGTATLTSLKWWGQAGEGDVATLNDSDLIVAENATNLQIKAASTSTTEVIKFTLGGIVRVNAAGTLIPQFTYSSAPGGAPTIKANSYFRLDYLGTGSFASNGTWS